VVQRAPVAMQQQQLLLLLHSHTLALRLLA
jgi:hypothetical protein